MIPLGAFNQKGIAVFGLGDSGIVSAEALAAGGALVHAWDDAEAGRKKAAQKNIPLDDLYDADWSAIDALVLSPGVPLTHPKPHEIVLRAQEAGRPIIGDIELFARVRGDLPEHSVVAVTGTNGKSTTTALIAHIVDACGGQAYACGNIGAPILAGEALDARGVYVIEMSSFQIDLTSSLKPEIAVLLNFSPDHIDRHGSFENYVAVKRRLLESQNVEGVAVVGVDDLQGIETVALLRAAGRHHVVPISCREIVPGGVYVSDGRLIDDLDGGGAVVCDLNECPALPGFHNWQNAAAAYSAARALGLAPKAIAASFQTFSGLAHRLETVGTARGVRFINDSKATNAVAAAGALAGFEHIHWIVGGQAKDGGIASLAPWFSHIERAYLIGDASEAFADELEGHVPYVKCGTLAAAFEAAALSAVESQVVLLSPACASYDQFANFVERGNAFTQLVANWQEHHP